MEVQIENLPKSKVKIKLRLTGEEFSPYLLKATENLAKTLNLPGFRPGKVPAEIAKEKLNENDILEEAANIALNDSFPKIVEEKGLKVLGRPQARIEKISRQEFEASIETSLFPKIELPDWKKIAKEEDQKEIKIEDKEVEDALSYLQKSRAKYVKVFEPASKGKQVEVDYEIRSGGVKIENGDIRGQKFILGENSKENGESIFIPGFEEKILGMRENEEKEFSLMAPSSFWQKELQGKPLDFKVRMKGVFKVDTPEINDEFAQSLGKFKNKEDLQKNISEGILEEKRQEEKIRWQSAVLGKIAKEAKIDLPDILIEEERDAMIDDLKKRIEQMGISFEQYLLHLKKSIDDLKKELLPEAEKRTRMLLCIYEIAKKENIKIEEKEIEEEINKILKQHPEMAEEIKSQEETLKSYLREQILQKKVVDLLLSQQSGEK
ncbi:MAG: trigger factor [Minisyncoccales bacterium]